MVTSHALRFVFLDFADTLVEKRFLFETIASILDRAGQKIPVQSLRAAHKRARELVQFPPRTSKEFYLEFNARFLASLGMFPESFLVEEIFQECSALPWVACPDLASILNLPCEWGVLSNWDGSLPEKIASILGTTPKLVVGSSECGHVKPSPRIFLEGARRAGLDPSNVAYVGDSMVLDVVPALKAGCVPILLDRHDNFARYSGPKTDSLENLPTLLSKLFGSVDSR